MKECVLINFQVIINFLLPYIMETRKIQYFILKIC